MNSAVIYFSKSGTTATIARRISDKLKIPSEGIIRLGGGGVLAFFGEVAQSLSGSKPNIQDIKLDITSFDKIIIGSPVWAGRVSSPVTSFLARYSGAIQSAAAFITRGSPTNAYTDVFTQIEGMLGKKLEATYSVASRDVKSGKYDLSAFLDTIQ
ncbi:MAG TPA: hypothetical protein DEP42_05850, partial [Ruminococcaceae bacterium]|nr:hypothetical protein [Oscillospiraceae bacterium]